jgi:hypothetical protein
MNKKKAGQEQEKRLNRASWSFDEKRTWGMEMCGKRWEEADLPELGGESLTRPGRNLAKSRAGEWKSVERRRDSIVLRRTVG